MSIARVGNPSGGTAATTSFNVTLAQAATGGNLLVVMVATTSGQTLVSAADDKSSVYATAYNTGRFAIFYTKSVVSGAATVTVTTSGTGGGCAICEEYSGCDPTAPKDQAGAVNTGAGVTQTSGSITPTASRNSVIVGLMYQTSTTSDFTASGSYNTVLNQDFTSQAENLGFIDQLVASTSGSYTTTSTSASVNWSAIAVNFIATAGGAAAPLFLQGDLNGIGSGGPFFKNPLG